MKKYLYLNNLVALLLVVGLVFSFSTTVIITPVILLLTFLFTIPLIMSIGLRKLPKLYVTILILYFYVLFSFFISGMKVSDFFNYQFIRYDGNFFYSYSPLLLLPIIRNHLIDNKRVLYIFVTLSPIAIFLSFFTPSFTFFEAHNALGGFMGIVIITNILLLEIEKSKFLIFPLFLSIYVIYMSDSRGSILAVIIALLYYYLMENSRTLKRIFIITLTVVMFTIIILGYRVWLNSGSPVALNLPDAMRYSLVLDPIGKFVFNELERGYTIIHRIYFYWPLALDDFFNSPLFGIGFSRYDDTPYQFSGIKHLLLLNTTPFAVHTNLHAHNSYLHILAELGIVGFTLYFLVFREILITSSKANKYSNIIKVLTYYMLIVSFTEHRITTPSHMIPYLIIVCLLISGNKKLKVEAKE